jgi:hypothetical protein
VNSFFAIFYGLWNGNSLGMADEEKKKIRLQQV